MHIISGGKEDYKSDSLIPSNISTYSNIVRLTDTAANPQEIDEPPPS